MHFNTKILHALNEGNDPAFNSVNTPIYQTTTYQLEHPEQHSKFQYSRTSNPTRENLEQTLATLENGKFGIAYSSGVAAIDAVLKTLKNGDEVISSKDLYGGTYRIFTKVFQQFGIRFHFVDLNNNKEIIQSINKNTKLIWLETPTNPLLNIVDIESLSKISKKHNLKLIVDNTFASPYIQSPLNLGADIVMHSASKYLGGHSDVILGALIVNDEKLFKKLTFTQNASGAIPGPMDCFLTLRGIKTLHVRMQRHCLNAAKIAEFLNTHSRVEKVFWPGFSNHPNHLVAKTQMKYFGGVVSFTTKENSISQALKLIKNLKLFTLAESLGGVESLVGHPATMSHASLTKDEREKAGICDGLIRLSIGIEESEDLINDLDRTLKT